MSMKTNLMLAALAAGACATPALAQDGSGNYVQINLGAIVGGGVEVHNDAPEPDDDYDLENAMFASVAGGLYAGGGLTLEGEVFHFRSDFGDDGVEIDADGATNAVMFNTIYTFEAGSLRPYVGAGLGWGKTEIDRGGQELNDSGLALQAKAGVTISMSDRVSWDIGYRYLSLPSFEATKREGGIVYTVLDADGAGHLVTIGARFKY